MVKKRAKLNKKKSVKNATKAASDSKTKGGMLPGIRKVDKKKLKKRKMKKKG